MLIVRSNTIYIIFPRFGSQQAGLNQRFARSVGIAVDVRRRNKSHESIQQNVQRLKEYKAKLIIFPVHEKKKLKKGEATVSNLFLETLNLVYEFETVGKLVKYLVVVTHPLKI